MSAAVILVCARLERSKKGKRVRVRAVLDSRAVQCSKAWRVPLVGAEPVPVRCVDMGAHWRMVGVE